MNDLLSLWRSPIDRLALAGAERMAARQPRGDYTIDQLPPLPAPDPNDIVPIWHSASGKTVGCAAGSFGGGAVLPIAFNTSFLPMTVYNYGNYVNTPGLSNAANTAALATMLNAMATSPSSSIIGGMAWIPNYSFGVNATQAGLFVPSGTIMQGLGNGGDNTSAFVIASVDALGDTLFVTQGPHTSGGTYFRNLSFQWVNPASVNDLVINAAAWGIKVQDCTFTDCPTSVAFGGNSTNTGGLGCTMERCVIRYGISNASGGNVPNNAVMIIMSGEQAQVIGPSEFFQRGHALTPNPGPSGVTGVGWGGGINGSEHQVLSGVHISDFQYGIDFSNRRSITTLNGGIQRFTIRDCEVDSYSQPLNLSTQSTSTTLIGGLIEGNTLNKGQNSQNDANAIVLLDTLNHAGGGNSNLTAITFVGNEIFSNVTSSDGKHVGLAANNQYGYEIRGGNSIRVIGGKVGNLGNNTTNGGGTWSDGSANVCISDTDPGGGSGGGGPGVVNFSTVGLGPGYGAGVYGGGANGAGQTQYGVLVSAALTNGPVSFDNCDMTGFNGTGQAAVRVSGSVASGTFYVRNCAGYNDQDTQIATAVQVGANTCSAYNASTLGGTSYYGPSYVQYTANSSGGTLTINGHTGFPLTANQYGFFWLNSPYDTFKFSLTPGLLNWRGR